LSLAREGAPWKAVSEVSSVLKLLGGPPADLAFDLLMPSADFRWRLFHLAVFGELLTELRTLGARLVSRRPIGSIGSGPAYSVDDARGRRWDLWFEGAAAWSYYGRDSAYKELCRAAAVVDRPLGPDILLVLPGEEAVAVECKYPGDGDSRYVLRDGFLQAATYSLEMIRLAPTVSSIIVGPEGTVGLGACNTAVGQISVGPPTVLSRVATRILTAR
jgi:hypothetical protein